MNLQKDIDHLLRSQQFDEGNQNCEFIYRYAEGLAIIENCVVVVSDLKANSRRIFYGGFSNVLGL